MRIRRAGTRPATAVLLLGLTAATGCAGDPDPGRERAPGRDTVLVEYLPGLTAEVHLPDEQSSPGTGEPGRAPLVVLVPGGSWTTADPSGLSGLASFLAEAGVAAAPTHLRAAQDGVLHPVPEKDVLCAVATTVAAARERGLRPGPVAVLGHSSGAHLAALAVLAYDDYAAADPGDSDPDPDPDTDDCAAPPVEPDALIGLSGPYDIARVPEIAAALVGSAPEDDPERWAEANPVTRAALRPDVPALLLHGEADDVVPVDFTTGFAEALEDAGHPVTVELLPDVDHLGVFQADAAGDLVARWLLGLPDAG